MIKENEPFWFLVTHIETEDQYLKIWAQTDKMVIQSVTKMLVSLQDKFDYCQTNIVTPNNVMPHTQCCARGPNNEFSRAKILGFRSDGMVLLQFVDYGNVVHAPVQNIRLLDNLPGSEYLFSIPHAATAFVLADVMPIGGTWMQEVVKEIRTSLVNHKYQGVYREINGYKILKFKMLNDDFGSLLVNRNMALFSSSCVNNTQAAASISVQGLRLPHQARHPTQENWRMPVVPQPVSQKVVKTNSFKAIQLEIGSVHDVQVSYVDVGPCKFSVQLLEAIPYLEVMMESINSRPHIALQESPIAGTVCLGKQTHPQRLCRVVLNSPGDNSCKVYYADYGHHEVLPFSSLYQIPDEFVVPNIFSIRFTLNGISGWNVSQEMKDYFGGLVANNNLKLRVCKGPLSPLTQYCDLYLNGKSIRDILSEVFPESCELLYPDPKQLKIGVKETVMVAFVESTAKFFVQIESDEKFLDEIMQQVDQASRTSARLTHGQLRKDMPCIALYDDQKWYRASILQIIDDTKVSVFYVDYGNQENVLLSNLRAIPHQLVNSLPKQAIQCSLNEYQFESSNQELIKKFENLVLEERMILVARDYVNASYIVNLHDARFINDPMADITVKLKGMAPLQNQMHIRNQESLEKYSVLHQRSDDKSQLVKKPRDKNKNIKSRENWTATSIWNKDKEESSGIQKTNFDTYDNPKSKFRKENENEQRHDNRFRRDNSDYQSGAPRRLDRLDQNDRYGKQTDTGRFPAAKDYPCNDRFNKSNDRNGFEFNKAGKDSRSNVNIRLDRSYGSDKDSDTSSKSGGKRNSRNLRQAEDQRNRDSPPNRNRTGRWENDATRNGLSNHNNADNQKAKPSKDSRNTLPDSTLQTKPKVASRVPPPNITAGAVKHCLMVYYKGPDSFYVQLCPDNQELNFVMEKIYSTYEKGGKIIPFLAIKEGLHCIAQWQEDKQWYRAVVKSINDSAVNVHFIDYGNFETVSSNKIKEIEPELAKLPAQAIHCKLFCPEKSDWTKQESDQFADAANDKILEAEFVTAEQGVYKILLKDVKTNEYLNDAFANGIDLLKEKDKIRNGVKSDTFPEYASLKEKWLENKVEFGKTYSVSQAWFLNPDTVYFHLQSQQKEFRDMMNEIQVVYAKRQPVSESLEVGSSVMAVLSDDGVLYRASVVGLDKPRGPVVQYVDYGDRAMVDIRNIYQVEKKFMILPRQALHCGLKNVAPVSGSNWSNVTEIGKFFNADNYDCVFHELQGDRYLISLNANGLDIGNALVQNGLAVFSSVEKLQVSQDVTEEIVQTEEVPKIDVNLLESQTLHVKVSNVEGINKFHVQFHTAGACQRTVDSYMASKDTQVMPGLLSHQVCLGAGCLVDSKGKWRRGVVVNFTKSYYEIRLIDTGEHQRLTLNSMLKLPGQLSAMQNQAVECSLFDVPPSSKADDMLKSLINGKDVKIFVEKVERNRLMVRLFDMSGNKITVAGTQSTERISPVCNMPILSSTHEVIVTNIKNSACVWLQRTVDVPIEKQLLDDMYDYYSKVKVQAVAIENEVFAGLWTDGNWYRVTVLQIRDTNEVKVQLIDYGDAGFIPARDLRTLDAQFYVPHQLAIRVSLSVSLSGSNDSQIELLEPMVKDKQLTATFYNVNRRWIAELSENGEKLGDRLKALNVVKEATIAPFEHAELGEMLVGERYDVLAPHVDTPSLLWLQRKEEEEALYDLHDRMQEVAASCADYEGVPEEKSLCLAMYSLDSCWYRAEVIDADADITTVRFIDYGNTDVIDSSAGRIKQLPDKWKSIKKYALACKLDVVPADGDDWSEEACLRIKHLASPDSALKALIVGDKAPMRVDLFLEDRKSICEQLVAERLAAYVKSADQLDEDLEVEEEEEEPFDPRSAFVSHVVSVDEFWVQEDAKVKDLEMVADRLVMASMFAPLEHPEPGLICIAHYPEDNQYYRALVLSHDDKGGGTKVSYIDYGNSAMTDDLKVIPRDLAEIPPLSKKCCLARPDGVKCWPDSVNAKFDKLAANGATVFILDFIAEGEPFLVRLTHDAKDVAMELLELCARPISAHDQGNVVHHTTKDISTKERPAPIGEENSPNLCKISSAVSPTCLWIQKKPDYLEIDRLLQRLSDWEILAPAVNVHPGQIIAARLSEDNSQCYRCKILNKTDAGIELALIDFGTLKSVHSDSMLRQLPDDLTHIPPLAVVCALQMPEGLEQWPESACQKFRDLTADQSAEFKFQLLDSEQPLSIVLHYKDQNVAELLLSKDESAAGLNTSCDDSAVHSETAAQKQNTDEHQHKEHLSCQEEEKIVPGSISRGLSVEDIARYSPVHPSHTCPEDKIVPGSINKGDTLEAPTSASCQENEPLLHTVAAVDDKDCENNKVVQIANDFQAICFDDKVVPSCISRGETPVEFDRPTTPKTAHSEKLVAGAVNAQSALDIEAETLTIEVKENIPEATV